MPVKALTLTEYLSLPTPPQRWLIEGLVPQQSFVVLWGAAKAGKTTLALQAGCSVTTGGLFLNQSCAQGNVLLLEVDTARLELSQLFARLQSSNVAVDPARLHLPAPDDLARYYPVNILKRETSQYLHELVALVKPSLVIVDCFRKLGRFKENESDGQVAIEETLKSLTTFHPSDPCACLLLHHTHKMKPDEALSVIDSGRGSNHLSTAVDSIWLLHQNRLHIQPRFAEDSVLPLQKGPGGVWSLR